MDEDVFKAIAEGFPLLKNVRNLKLDLTCGVWDWDGFGSPQQGPSEQYKFPCISNHIREFEIQITDMVARQRRGPLGLVDTGELEKLRISIIPW